MAKLNIYTAFHLNLAFSSIPEEQYALVIDKCYWPILDILEEFNNIKFGIELTAYTLEKIKEVDYTFIEKLKKLYDKDKCEIIGSGMSQAIFPLIPEKVNIKNMEIGDSIYEEILGFKPTTGYVNEQCHSDGIVESYYVNGYKNLIVEYENSNLFNKYPKEYKYQAHKIRAGQGKLNLIWNSSIAFQKFQKYAFGQTNIEDYLNYLNNHIDEKEDRALCIYGSDLEIFDYKPGNHDWFYHSKESKEIDRLYTIFEALNSSSKFNFILPNEVAKECNSEKIVSISTPEYPIVCKKQPKYNAVRWAVSGIENTKMNTECYRLYQKLNFLSKFNKDNNNLWRSLSLLYGSDYRTKTTESKLEEYHYLLGKTDALIDKELSKLKNLNKIDSIFVVVNMNDYDIKKGFIYECDVKFKQGEVFQRKHQLYLNNIPVNFQFEDIENYRDSSIRKCKLIIELPNLKPREKVYAKFKENLIIKESNWEINDNMIETKKVRIKFSNIKNGTIEKLVLRDISEDSILGKIEHGYYDDIRYSSDYFSGHTILREDSLKQITDLESSNIIYPKKEDYFNVRIPIRFKTSGEFGELWKVYYVYMNQSRVDIEYNFRFNDTYPIFFRTGILTFNPQFFDIETLKYSTHNGGKIEEYSLLNKEFNQSDMVSLNVSANGCLGGTEEKLIFRDKNKKVVIQRDNSAMYTVPMIEYREINDEYMLRVYHSLSETDDTGSIFWRGHGKFKMSISDEENNFFNHGLFEIKRNA